MNKPELKEGEIYVGAIIERGSKLKEHCMYYAPTTHELPTKGNTWWI